MFLLALALAVLVGTSLGLLGGGGSILAVPILRYVLGMQAHQAIALSLLIVGTTSVAALIPHARLGRVRWRTGIIFGLAAMLGAFTAGRFAHLIPELVLLLGFALMMFATAIAMLRKPSQAAATAPPPAARGDLPIVKVLIEGAVVGAITGLVGAGGGFLVVPALVLLGGLPMELAVGTSLVVICMKSLAGFAGYVSTVAVDWYAGLAFSAAAIGGSVAGGMLASRVRPAALRGAFGWFVVAMAFFILGQELPAALNRPASPALAAAGALIATSLLAAGWAASRRRQARRPKPARKRANDTTLARAQSLGKPITQHATGGEA
ncbi:MAG TPA: sulfite exporter TauE/SafE family protein [Polyangiales bacterium]|nr:sulfite exporter TauE/SafE family protein [Polyangiales bacterium]